MNQGKALGGSSAINAQVWVPPVPSIVNYWESHLGNPGWNWEALRPYLSKSFTSPPNNDSLAEVLGIDGWTDKAISSGPIRTEYAGNASHPIRKIWADTFRSTGHYMANDPFLNASVGSFSSLSSVDPQTKERSTSATAYYHPIISRANLHVVSNATAEKVLLSNQGQGNQPVKATGVLYRHNGELKEVACSKEVVVAAGALQSPKVLELSGIGDSELLKQYGIDTIIDLPGVGENLYDHLLCSFSFAAVDDLETLDAILRQEPDAVKEAMEQYTENRTGPLTSMGVYSFAYLPVLEHASTEGHERLVKLLRDNRPAPGNTPDHARAQAFYKMAETSLLDPAQPSCAYLSFISQFVGTFEPNTKSLSISAMHSQPLSRGTVHIQSNDVATKPTVNPDYLSNPVDLEIFAANLLQIETMVRTSPLSTLLKEPLTHRDPASNLTDLEAAKNWIRKNGSSMWHMGGSCASTCYALYCISRCFFGLKVC